MGNFCCCCNCFRRKDDGKGTLERELSRGPITEIQFKMSSTEQTQSIRNSKSRESRIAEHNDNDVKRDQLKDRQRENGNRGQSDYATSKSRQRRSRSSNASSKNLSKEIQTVKHFLDKKGYDWLQTIGSGNYAEVYKAFNRQHKKTVAVKVIDLRKTEEHYRRNFLPNEVAVMKTCKHINLIKIYQLIQTENRVIMVMEYAPKGTLADWLRDQGVLNDTQAQLTFPQIIDAIHCLHSNRIAHRDLKLENILLTENYDPKVSDFSYATKFGPNDPLSTSFCGSLPYFPPEILLRKPHNPLIADIWSLGVCFYIMVNDCLPFRVGDDKKMVRKQLDRDWKFRPNILIKSEELKEIIKRMLEPEVTLRVTTDQLMEDKWVRQ